MRSYVALIQAANDEPRHVLVGPHCLSPCALVLGRCFRFSHDHIFPAYPPALTPPLCILARSPTRGARARAVHGGAQYAVIARLADAGRARARKERVLATS